MSDERASVHPCFFAPRAKREAMRRKGDARYAERAMAGPLADRVNGVLALYTYEDETTDWRSSRTPSAAPSSGSSWRARRWTSATRSSPAPSRTRSGCAAYSPPPSSSGWERKPRRSSASSWSTAPSAATSAATRRRPPSSTRSAPPPPPWRNVCARSPRSNAAARQEKLGGRRANCLGTAVSALFEEPFPRPVLNGAIGRAGNHVDASWAPRDGARARGDRWARNFLPPAPEVFRVPRFVE